MPLLPLDDTQQEIQSLARSYAERELVPLAAERDRESRFDRSMVEQLAGLGFFGMLTPEGIYREARNRDHAISMLRELGYIT